MLYNSKYNLSIYHNSIIIVMKKKKIKNTSTKGSDNRRGTINIINIIQY